MPVLERVFSDAHSVLEIAAGTGQHSVYFSQHLPHLNWLPTDRAPVLAGLAARCEQQGNPRLAAPKALDVTMRPWPIETHDTFNARLDAYFSANSLHIMPFSAVEVLFAELAQRVKAQDTLAIYGPFNYGGRYTSDSNARFDQWLEQQHPESAIRDFEAVDGLAKAAGFRLLEDNEMPANNRLLVWRVV